MALYVDVNGVANNSPEATGLPPSSWTVILAVVSIVVSKRSSGTLGQFALPPGPAELGLLLASGEAVGVGEAAGFDATLRPARELRDETIPPRIPADKPPAASRAPRRVRPDLRGSWTP